MRDYRRITAGAELLLVFPATLFMATLVVRNFQPEQFEPAHTARRIVNWYAGHTAIGLWVLLIALPLTVLVTGGAALLRLWNSDADFRRTTREALSILRAYLSELLLAAATFTAAAILAIVALHVIAD